MNLTAQQMKSLTKEDIKELCKQRGISHISAVLHDEFQSHRNLKLAKIQHWWFRQNHPFDRDVCSLYLKNCLKLGFYDDARALIGERILEGCSNLKLICIHLAFTRKVSRCRPQCRPQLFTNPWKR